MTKLYNLSLKETLDNLSKREISSLELINGYIERINILDKYNLVSEKLYEDA